MRIVIVSWHFPPVNAIAAVRLGKLARYLVAAGHEVRVVTAEKGDPDRSLPLDVDGSSVTTTPFFDVDRYLNPKSWLQRLARPGSAGKPSAGAPSATRPGWLKRIYAAVMLYPDRQAGWLAHLLPTLSRLVGQWRPDLILTSGPPFSPFIATALVARRHGIPWIAEFRDRWIDDPYFSGPEWRRPFDRWLERRVVRSAAGVVTVSEPWARLYAAKYGTPAVTVMNGFDPDDFPTADERPAESLPLCVLHAGTVYPERRDPTALFQAIAGSGLTPDEVRIVFYGRHFEYLARQIDACGVVAFVETHAPVSWPEAVELQRRSDILLLMQWNDPADLGNVPGKLFEYLAVSRPILGLGPTAGIPAQLIRAREAGLYSNDPNEIAAALRAWVEEKRRTGRVARLPERARAGLSRDAQYALLDGFLERVHEDAERSHEHAPRHALARSIEAGSLVTIETRVLAAPTLVVVVDAEADFDWNGPFSHEDHRLDSIHCQEAVDRIFARYGVRPTYLVDYPLAASPEASSVLRRLHERGRCELGVQLHPWTTPPFEELLGERNSFPCNLSEALQRAKLESLLEIARRNLRIEPRVFKAGRYGVDDVTLALLTEAGFLVDTSVVPYTSFALSGGPSFHGAPAGPFWVGNDRGLLELPVTRGFTGILPPMLAAPTHRLLDESLGRRLHLPGIASRVGLCDRLTLSPEGSSLADLEALTRTLLAGGQRLLTFSFHSPSLAPGNTPYTRDAAELAGFLGRIEGYLRFFFEELGGVAATALEARAMLGGAQPQAAGPAVLDRAAAQ